ncbi:hypothetical protein CDE51_08095 [Pasteurella multocida]|uniref:hypothetical protein n=1 Tax=Pasteurella multocida TaxID=747 RepID=UPI000B62365A|nr:hypothetical protein [Pasteurella multocida]MBF6983130.1 hypothetical protein [Pasteurella multocida]OWZ81789.1 hypothetical protein CDE51_08095 [Pasteurella multocida]
MDLNPPKTTLAEFLILLNNLENRIITLEQNQISEQFLNPDEIWTPKDIANYAKCSYGYVMQTLIHEPNFPKTLGNHKAYSPRKYRANDVVLFFKHRNTNR